jgi:hypothetical protein
MSISKITYLDQIITYKLFVFSSFEFLHLHFCDEVEISLFLKNLDIDQTYVLTLELWLSEDTCEEDPPVITLCKPILITKSSNPTLISKFILNQISLADNRFNLDYDLIKNMALSGGPFVLVKYNKINLF